MDRGGGRRVCSCISDFFYCYFSSRNNRNEKAEI
jgi:hypothetical protein